MFGAHRRSWPAAGVRWCVTAAGANAGTHNCSFGATSAAGYETYKPAAGVTLEEPRPGAEETMPKAQERDGAQTHALTRD